MCVLPTDPPLKWSLSPFSLTVLSALVTSFPLSSPSPLSHNLLFVLSSHLFSLFFLYLVHLSACCHGGQGLFETLTGSSVMSPDLILNSERTHMHTLGLSGSRHTKQHHL